MCIGIPMQVESIGLALAVCRSQGAGAVHRVCTALVGDVTVGDWLLVSIDTAVEVISADWAAEVLAMLERSTRGGGSTEAAAFALPSSVSRERLLALTSGT